MNVCLWSLLLVMPFARAAETGWLPLNTDLRAKPELSMPSLTTLPAGSQVQIQQRQGRWLKVKTRTQQGWLRRIDIGLPPTAIKAAPTKLNLVARPELAFQLDSYHLSRQQAERMARQRQLSAHAVRYIEQPEPAHAP